MAAASASTTHPNQVPSGRASVPGVHPEPEANSLLLGPAVVVVAMVVVVGIAGVIGYQRQTILARLNLPVSWLDRYAYLSGAAMNAFIWQSTRMAIPAAGGLIIALAEDTWPIFAVATLGFLVFFFIVGLMKIMFG